MLALICLSKESAAFSQKLIQGAKKAEHLYPFDLSGLTQEPENFENDGSLVQSLMYILSSSSFALTAPRLSVSSIESLLRVRIEGALAALAGRPLVALFQPPGVKGVLRSPFFAPLYETVFSGAPHIFWCEQDDAAFEGLRRLLSVAGKTRPFIGALEQWLETLSCQSNLQLLKAFAHELEEQDAVRVKQ